jgi:hypothetical protein
MSNITLTIPQWTVGASNTVLFTLSGSRTWVNAIILPNDGYFGSVFSVTSNSVTLLSNEVLTSSIGSLFVLQDNLNVQYPFNVIVQPPVYSVPTSNVVYLFDSITNLPIQFVAPTTSTGTLTFPQGYETLLTSVTPKNLPRTNSVTFVDYNFSPILPPGLTSSMDGAGNVSVTGTPTTSRAAAVYTLYTRTAITQTAATRTTIQVAPARFQFSNVSGYSSDFRATLEYKKPNDLRFSTRPATLLPLNILTDVPTGMTYSVVGSNVILSGTPTQFLDTPLETRISVVGPGYVTGLTSTFSMDASLELFADNAYTVYSRNTYTFASPMFTVTTDLHPPVSNAVVTYSYSPPITGLTLSRGVFFGYLSNASSNNITVTVSSTTGLSNSKTFALNVINETITITSTLQGCNVPATSFQFIENVGYGIQVNASTNTGRDIRSYAIGTNLIPGSVGIDQQTGVLSITSTGVPSASNTYTLNVIANAEVASSSQTITINVTKDILTFQAYGLSRYSNSSSRFRFIQGRPIEQDDYVNDIIGFRATATSGRPVYSYSIQSDLTASGIRINSQTGILTGTPLLSGEQNGTIKAITVDGIESTTPFYFNTAPDELIIVSPTTTDFTVGLGNTITVQITAYSFSVSPINTFIIAAAGAVPIPEGILITPTGLLTITGYSFQSATPFLLGAQTHDGITVTVVASLTVVDPIVGSFSSPTASSILYIPVGGTFPIITDPPDIPVTISGSTRLSISNSRILNSGPSIYPPVLASLTAYTNMTIPIRVTDKQLEPYVLYNPSTHWIQYAPIEPLTISAVPISDPVLFSVPFPPRGLKWNPFTSSLTGSPYDLTIQSRFIVFASDGNTVQPYVISYTTKTPAYLRLFSAPSSYTNYVKQRAFINAAVHALDNTAFLPDAILASETAPYPLDASSDIICRNCKVQSYVPEVVNLTGWAPFNEADWVVTPTSLTFVGTNEVTPYTYINTVQDYSRCFIKFKTPTLHGGNVQVGVGPINVKTVIAYGFQFDTSGNMTMLSARGYPITYISPSTLSYSTLEDFTVAYSGGLVYYLIQGCVVAQTTLKNNNTLAIGALVTNTDDDITQIVYGGNAIGLNAASNWYVRDGRSWTIGPNFVSYVPSSLPLFTSTIVSTTTVSENGFMRFTPISNVVGLAGYTTSTTSTTIDYGYQLNSGTNFSFVGSNITAVTSDFSITPGTELALLTKAGNTFFLRDGSVIGIGSYVPQVNRPLVKLTQATLGTLSNLYYDVGTNGYSLRYNPFIPSNKWLAVTTPYQSLTHIASTTDTALSYLRDSNMYITAQPSNAAAAVVGLCNTVDGIQFRIAFNDPTTGTYSAYVNTSNVASGTMTSRSYYALSVSGAVMKFYKDGTTLRSFTMQSPNIFQALVTMSGNGDSYAPVSVASGHFINVEVPLPGNWYIGDDYIEKRTDIPRPDYAIIYPPTPDSRFDFTFISFANDGQFVLQNTLDPQAGAFDVNVFSRPPNIVINRMFENGTERIFASIPIDYTNGTRVGLQVQGATITVFSGNTAIATIPTKGGRTGITAPWRYFFYGGGDDAFTAKNIVLTPL